MLLQQLLEKIMRKKKFSKLVSSCQYYCLLGTVHTTSSAGGFDYANIRVELREESSVKPHTSASMRSGEVVTIDGT